MRWFKRAVPLVLILADIVTVVIAIVMAYESREFFIDVNDIPLEKYVTYVPFYIPVALFLYSGLYRYRFDFWHESKIVVKSLVFSLLIVLSFLALTRTVTDFSRYVIVMAFGFMAFLIPLQKRMLKWILFHMGLWKKEAKFLGRDEITKRTFLHNYYLGYVESEKEYQTLFINSHELPPQQIEEHLKREILKHHELLFIPLIRDFNLADSVVFELINSRSNLILLKNRFASKMNLILKEVSDRVLAIIITIAAFPLFSILALLVYLDDPKASIFYLQKRIGRGGRRFVFYKFRTMYPDARKRLRNFLQDNPELAKEYERYKKLRNDPRITPIGKFLRRYSLDELPQIINVLKGEMSLVGPRPYLPSEVKELGEYAKIIFSVKPGMTGLWQVSGRSQLTFEERKHIDLWYVYNWSLWKDVVILLKTFRAMLAKEGAY